MIETFRVSTLIRSYLIDVGDFSLIYPFWVKLFLSKRVLDLCSVKAVFDETCFIGLCLMGCV